MGQLITELLRARKRSVEGKREVGRHKPVSAWVQVPFSSSSPFFFSSFSSFCGEEDRTEAGFSLWLAHLPGLPACLLLFLPLLLLFLLDWIRYGDVQWSLQIAQVGFIEIWLLVVELEMRVFLLSHHTPIPGPLWSPCRTLYL